MEQIKEQLILASKNYHFTDKQLENVCSDRLDPIACTVFAYKQKNLNKLPKESFDAAYWLKEVVRLSEILIKEYHKDPDEVRKIYFDILNQ